MRHGGTAEKRLTCRPVCFMRETRDRTVIVGGMTSVLGVSVGASAVRFACHDAVTLETPIFQSRSVTATLERPEELAAESIGTVLAERDETDEVQAIGVAYQDEAQAGAVQAAMARLKIGNFQLVPEVTAALQMLEMSGELGDHSTLVFYDLGSSGLTVTVVDRDTGMVLSSARSDQISGDLVDRLICDNQLELHRFAHPADAAATLALAARCRDAKEQLSTNGAVWAAEKTCSYPAITWRFLNDSPSELKKLRPVSR